MVNPISEHNNMDHSSDLL